MPTVVVCDTERALLPALPSGVAVFEVGEEHTERNPKLRLLPLPINGPLILASFSEQARLRLVRWCPTNIESTPLALEAGKAALPALLGALLVGLNDRLRAMASQNAALLLSNATIRKDLEETQENFRALEQHLAWTGPGEHLAFIAEPGSQSVAIPGGEDIPPIGQLLPLPTVGICGLGLFLGLAQDRDASNTLEVELAIPGASGCFKLWRRPSPELKPGWNNFRLDRSLAGPGRSLEVRVRMRDSAGGVSVALSDSHPIARTHASGIDSDDRPLALRLWRSVPGADMTATVGRLKAGPDRQSTVYRLTADQYESAQLDGFAPQEQRAMATVDAIRNEFQLHPKPRTVVAATLRSLLPAGTRRFVCQVCTRHPQAPPIDYAVLAGPPRGPFGNLLIRRRLRQKSGAGGFTGWLRCESMRQRQLELVFGEPLPQPTDLVFLTRPHGLFGTTSFAWARFFDAWYEVQEGLGAGP